MSDLPSDEAVEAAIEAARWAGTDGPLPRRVEVIVTAAYAEDLPRVRAEERAATIREVVEWLNGQGQQVEVGWTGWTKLAADAIEAHFNPEANEGSLKQ